MLWLLYKSRREKFEYFYGLRLLLRIQNEITIKIDAASMVTKKDSNKKKTQKKQTGKIALRTKS